MQLQGLIFVPSEDFRKKMHDLYLKKPEEVNAIFYVCLSVLMLKHAPLDKA